MAQQQQQMMQQLGQQQQQHGLQQLGQQQQLGGDFLGLGAGIKDILAPLTLVLTLFGIRWLKDEKGNIIVPQGEETMIPVEKVNGSPKRVSTRSVNSLTSPKKSTSSPAKKTASPAKKATPKPKAAKTGSKTFDVQSKEQREQRELSQRLYQFLKKN